MTSKPHDESQVEEKRRIFRLFHEVGLSFRSRLRGTGADRFNCGYRRINVHQLGLFVSMSIKTRG